MAKRYTDSNIWKTQRWFKKLSPNHKLVWKYLTDTCDHAGVWKIDFGQLVDDTGIDDFNLSEFIEACNYDFDKETGVKIIRERVRLINKCTLWITGFIRFQYENKDFMVNPSVAVVHSALTILNGYLTLNEALDKGYLTLSQPYTKTIVRTKDKDKDIIIEVIKKLEEGAQEKFKEPEKKMYMYLVVEMANMYKKKNQDYFFNKEYDYSACLQIAYKISEMKGWKKSEVISERLDECLVSWDKIIDFIKTDTWLITRSLNDLSSVKEWQRLVQKMSQNKTEIQKQKTEKVKDIHQIIKERGY